MKDPNCWTRKKQTYIKNHYLKKDLIKIKHFILNNKIPVFLYKRKAEKSQC